MGASGAWSLVSKIKSEAPREAEFLAEVTEPVGG